MGLVTHVERWGMPAAIGMATEGVRAKYNIGAGGGGFGVADREIGAKLDGAKVLAAVDRMEHSAQHLSDWCMFAYASPLWNASENKKRFLQTVLNDWALFSAESGMVIQQKTFERMAAIIAVVAGGFALEQLQGASVNHTNGELAYQPKVTRSYLIHLLVAHDVEQFHATMLERDISLEQFENQRRRYYQTHWDSWAKHVEQVRTLLMNYDKAARTLFKQELAKQNGSH
ncbi:hypothetical protein [Vibrio vulnificus]|uniref:hypothetical protein n=1 Tax=Vibrio vulnificus TaxID=672 RepID=UPI000C7A62EC|nr:hypothetical protein [Vibrio vulnificus]AUL97479.1 hypothetical protein FORC54_3334 [Vibrio vulnificus]